MSSLSSPASANASVSVLQDIAEIWVYPSMHHGRQCPYLTVSANRAKSGEYRRCSPYCPSSAWSRMGQDASKVSQGVSGCLVVSQGVSGFVSGCLRLSQTVSGCLRLSQGASDCLKVPQTVSDCVRVPQAISIRSSAMHKRGEKTLPRCKLRESSSLLLLPQQPTKPLSGEPWT